MARSTLTYALLLLLLTPMTALAAPPTPTQSPFETFGQWTVQRIDGVNLATVGNESGNALMLRCDTTGCAYLFLSPIIPCTPGVRSNMLFTSSANVGNLSLQAACADKATAFTAPSSRRMPTSPPSWTSCSGRRATSPSVWHSPSKGVSSTSPDSRLLGCNRR